MSRTLSAGGVASHTLTAAALFVCTPCAVLCVAPRDNNRIQGPVINLGRPCISLGNMQVAVDPTVNLSGARVHLAEPQITFK